MSEYGLHLSVLFEECLEWLTKDVPTGPVLFADLTFGGGGHALSLAKKSQDFFVLCTDQDPEALSNGHQKIKEFNLQNNVILEDTNFSHFQEIAQKNFTSLQDANNGIFGILLDLGVSSHHFDKAERGFSFRFDGPLDMRMDVDNEQIMTAKEIVNTYSQEDLQEIFWNYGEERFSKRIAQRIVEVRESREIESTKDLEDIIFHCYPKKMRFGKTNPATRVFQALRIEVNKELSVLTDTLPQLLSLLAPNGRLLVISFHSLEDRIVKTIFKQASMDGNYRLITKKPIVPSDEEIKRNSRSRSAKLRIIQRIG